MYTMNPGACSIWVHAGTYAHIHGMGMVHFQSVRKCVWITKLVSWTNKYLLAHYRDKWPASPAPPFPPFLLEASSPPHTHVKAKSEQLKDLREDFTQASTSVVGVGKNSLPPPRGMKQGVGPNCVNPLAEEASAGLLLETVAHVLLDPQILPPQFLLVCMHAYHHPLGDRQHMCTHAHKKYPPIFLFNWYTYWKLCRHFLLFRAHWRACTPASPYTELSSRCY